MAKIPVFVTEVPADTTDDEIDALAEELYERMVDAIREHQAEPADD